MSLVSEAAIHAFTALANPHKARLNDLSEDYVIGNICGRRRASIELENYNRTPEVSRHSFDDATELSNDHVHGKNDNDTTVQSQATSMREYASECDDASAYPRSDAWNEYDQKNDTTSQPNDDAALHDKREDTSANKDARESRSPERTDDCMRQSPDRIEEIFRYSTENYNGHGYGTPDRIEDIFRQSPDRHDERRRVTPERSPDRHDERRRVTPERSPDRHDERRRGTPERSPDRHDERRRGTPERSPDRHDERRRGTPERSPDRHDERRRGTPERSPDRHDERRRGTPERSPDRHDERRRGTTDEYTGLDMSMNMFEDMHESMIPQKRHTHSSLSSDCDMRMPSHSQRQRDAMSHVSVPRTTVSASDVGPNASLFTDFANNRKGKVNRSMLGDAYEGRSMEAEYQEKQNILLDIAHMKMNGTLFSRDWCMDDSLDEMKYEMRRQMIHSEEEKNKKMMRDGMRMVCSGIEMLNNRIKILDLSGWSSEVCDDMSKYDNALAKLHRKYWGRSNNMSPELEIATGILMSMGMHHFKRKLATRMFSNMNSFPPKADFPGKKAATRSSDTKRGSTRKSNMSDTDSEGAPP